jgi:hypothetical protein
MFGLVIAICAVMLVTNAGAVGEADELQGLKKAKVEATRKYLAGLEEAIKAPPAGDRPRLTETISDLADWSKRSMESQLDLIDAANERDAVIKAHIDLLEKWLVTMKELQKGETLVTDNDLLSMEYKVLDAKVIRLKNRRGAKL